MKIKKQPALPQNLLILIKNIILKMLYKKLSRIYLI